MPNEDELAYRYCGEEASFSDTNTVIFCEKKRHGLGSSDVRHVVYADGRVEIPPSDWPRIAAGIERQQSHRKSGQSPRLGYAVPA